METIREEIYDENGLVKVIVHQVEKTEAELLAEKEAELLRVYEELKQLRGE
jgi:hypothetical protein